jgi:hypothetical protein
MGVINTSQSFANGDSVTSTKLNNIAGGSTFDAGAVSGTGLVVTAGGLLSLGTVASSNMGNNSVLAGAIADGVITNAKISASAAIDLSKLATGALPTAITVDSANISNDAATQLKIGTNTVGRGPLARVYLTGTQALTANSDSKVLFNNINYNTNSDYSLATNKYTASVAGYYSFTANILCNAGQNLLNVSLRLNGAQFAKGSQSADDTYSSTVSDMIYLAVNDFIEVYAYSNPGCTLNGARFSAVMVRSGAN